MRMLIPESIKSYVRNTPAFYRPIIHTRRVKRWKRRLTEEPSLLQQTIDYHRNPEDFILVHWSKSDNFGDATSPMVVELLSGKKALLLADVLGTRAHANYSVVGSVLQFPANTKTEVWGSGFISQERIFYFKPAKIHAVRGPLTREVCLKQGLECPEVYGDPAVFLFDRYTNLPRRPNFKVGFVPHYHDHAHASVQEFMKNDAVLTINVYEHPKSIAEKMLQCDVIVSSSLHGLIMADALQIPSRWLGVSSEVMKGGFKFQDYFLSVARDEPSPLAINALTVERAVKEGHLRHKPFSREKLLENCPFFER